MHWLRFYLFIYFERVKIAQVQDDVSVFFFKLAHDENRIYIYAEWEKKKNKKKIILSLYIQMSCSQSFGFFSFFLLFFFSVNK